jgi:hypothetical protein
MDQEPGPVTQGEDTDEIRARIERTRAEMSETIDAIQERLSPRNIVSNAKENLKSRAVDGAKRLAERSKAVVHQARDNSWSTEDVAAVVRDNAVPIVAGVAVAVAAHRTLQAMARPRTSTWLVIGACTAVAFWSVIKPPDWDGTRYVTDED